MHQRLVSKHVSLLLSLCTFVTLTWADLLDCVDCCTSDEHIGVATFTSNVTSEGPLAWSVASSTEQDPGNSTLTQYHRDFWLNTPPSLNLSNVTDFSGCGVFFYDITPALQIDQNFTSYSDYSCDTVMSSQCQQDIVQQAADELDVFLSQNENIDTTNLDYTLCRSLGTRFTLNLTIPANCAFSTKDKKWGNTQGSGTRNLLTSCAMDFY